MVILALSLPPPTHADQVREVRELTIVAVTSLPNGTYAGVSARLRVLVVCPGSGGVYVETLPLSQIDLQASTRIAAIVASRVAGVRFSSCDFLASIRADSPIVGGPSASAATAVAFAAALLGLPLRGDAVLTGMVLPDGSVGPVGGLRAKLEAAARSGARLFLVPYGQTVYTETVVVPQTVGPVTIYTTRTVTVDLVDYGRRLGVEVVPIATVHEALQILTGGAYRTPGPAGGDTAVVYENPAVERRVRVWSEALRSRTLEEMGSGDSIKAEVLSSLPPSLRASAEAAVDELEREVASLLSRADSLYQRGYLYSAASTYFRALTYSLWRLYLLEGLRGPGVLDSARSNITERVDRVMRIAWQSPTRAGALCLQDLDVRVAVLSRAYEALMHLNASLSESRVDRLAYYLALADSRATTAELWSLLLESGYTEGGDCCLLDTGYVEDSALVVENLVRNIYAYVVSFEGRVSIPVVTFESMVSMMNLMARAREPIDRLSLGVEALAYGYATLVSMFSRDVNNTVTALNRTVSAELASEPLRRCLPISLVLYLELAGTQEAALSKVYILARVSALASFYADSLREAGPTTSALVGAATPVCGEGTSGVRTVTLTEALSAPAVAAAYVGIGVLLGASLALIVVVLSKRLHCSTRTLAGPLAPSSPGS